MKMSYSIGQTVEISFDEKPSNEIIGILKTNRFRWSPQSKVWWRNGAVGSADLITSLQKMIEPKKPDGDCWLCGSPNGYFRKHGAGTPVYCDNCHRRDN